MRALILVSASPVAALDVATRWAEAAAGRNVMVVLLDAAVTSARPRHRAAGALLAATEAGVAVHAEAGALARRGLDVAGLAEGVKAVDLDEVADMIVRAEKVVWL